MRALVSGATGAEAAWASGFVLGWVLLPGFVLWRVLRMRATDGIGELAMAGALGTSLLVLGSACAARPSARRWRPRRPSSASSENDALTVYRAPLGRAR